MQKFQFKLEALLKVRSFKEDSLKIELGNIVKDIQECKNKITNLDRNIDQAYESQNTLLAEDSSGSFLRFYPYYVEAQKNNIELLRSRIFVLTKKYDAKVIELKQAMADLKVLENMKEKEMNLYKHEVVKTEMQNTEELFMMRKKDTELENEI